MPICIDLSLLMTLRVIVSFLHSFPFSGKQVRTKLSQAFNHWLNVPEDKLQVTAHLQISAIFYCSLKHAQSVSKYW